MSFLNPFFLLALLAVSIPLLIHLIRLRRVKRVRFSTLQFLDSLRTSTLKKIRLKKWLLLALRMMVVALLALALAGPYLPGEEGMAGWSGEGTTLAILLDNSPSMDQVNQGGSLFDQAVEAASGIISGAGGDDRILLEVTNGASLNLPPLNRAAAQTQLRRLQPVNRGNFLREHLDRLLPRLHESHRPAGRLYLITDGQATQFGDLAGVQPGLQSGIPVRVLILGEQVQPNVAITGWSLEQSGVRPGLPLTIHAEVTNFGSQPVRNYLLGLEQGVEMVTHDLVDLDGGQAASYSFEWVPDDEVNPTGALILEGDELIFDNRRYFSVRIPERRRVVLVRDRQAAGDDSSYLQTALETAAGVDRRLAVERAGWQEILSPEEDPPDALLLDEVGEIPGFMLDRLIDYLQSGGGVLLLPSADGDMASYNRFLERVSAGRYTGVEGSYGSFRAMESMERLRQGHPVLEELFEPDDEELRIDLPEIFYRYRLERGGGRELFDLLRTAQGEPLMMERQTGRGLLVVSAFGAGPEWSTFPVKPLFAPFFYRLAHYLGGGERAELLEHTLGEAFEWRLPASTAEVSLDIGGRTILPNRSARFGGDQLRDPAMEWEPGMAELVAGESSLKIALNQDTMESDFQPLEEYELVQLLERRFENVRAEQLPAGPDASVVLAERSGRGGVIWHWFILAALFFLLTESITARLFKAETIQ